MPATVLMVGTRKGLWIGLGTLGLMAAGSAYGLYRLATTYYDFGPAAAELPEAAKAYRAAGLPFVAKDVAPIKPDPSKDATPSLRAARKLLPKKGVQSELAKAARNPGPAPYLDYRPLSKDERPSLEKILDESWLRAARTRSSPRVCAPAGIASKNNRNQQTVAHFGIFPSPATYGCAENKSLS